jgi:hypothetical protein
MVTIQENKRRSPLEIFAGGWVFEIREWLERIFARLDRIQFRGKPIFGFFIWKWQYYFYSGLVAYFLWLLAFGKVGLYDYNTLTDFWVAIHLPWIHGQTLSPILNRGLNNGGHLLAYLSLIACCFAARWKMPKTAKGFYFSILIPAAALSVSEGSFNIWYQAYYAPVNVHLTWDLFILTNPLAIFYIVVIAVAFLITPITQFTGIKNTLLAIGIIQVYFFFWSLAGLEVTLSTVQYFNGGPGVDTKWFDNIPVNLTEIGQWVVGASTFIAITVKANLMKIRWISL